MVAIHPWQQFTLTQRNIKSNISCIWGVVDIKKQFVNAYILLESLVTLGVFAMITSLLLASVIQGRRQQVQDMKQQEVLNVAKMAVQIGESKLTLNEVHVDILRNKESIQVVHEGKVVLGVEKE